MAEACERCQQIFGLKTAEKSHDSVMETGIVTDQKIPSHRCSAEFSGRCPTVV